MSNKKDSSAKKSMKPLKQRAIPEGTVEIVVRGSKFEAGNLSARFVVPSSVAAQILSFGLSQTAKKKRQLKPSKKSSPPNN